jgi:hypothetical protein
VRSIRLFNPSFEQSLFRHFPYFVRAARTSSGDYGQRLSRAGAGARSVSALAGLDLNELGDDFEALGGGESSDGGALVSMPARPQRSCSRARPSIQFGLQ